MNHPLVVYVRDCPEDEGTYIGRGTPWGNPFCLGRYGDRREVLRKHVLWLDGMIEAPNRESPPSKAEIRKYLRGRKLRCHCAPRRCHGDVLAKIANQPLKGLFR